MADYGDDVSTYPDGLDPTFTIISGPRVLAEHIARMFETAEGTYEDDPDFALLVADQINAPQTAGLLARFIGKMVSKIEQDERVLSASVEALFTPPTRRLTFRVSIDPVDGLPFRFVLAIDAVTVAVLDGTF